jgi:methyl-accepting chemotaxis protein
MAALDPVIARALERAPEARFKSPQQFTDAFSQAVSAIGRTSPCPIRAKATPAVAQARPIEQPAKAPEAIAPSPVRATPSPPVYQAQPAPRKAPPIRSAPTVSGSPIVAVQPPPKKHWGAKLAPLIVLLVLVVLTIWILDAKTKPAPSASVAAFERIERDYIRKGNPLPSKTYLVQLGISNEQYDELCLGQLRHVVENQKTMIDQLQRKLTEVSQLKDEVVRNTAEVRKADSDLRNGISQSAGARRAADRLSTQVGALNATVDEVQTDAQALKSSADNAAAAMTPATSNN